MSNEKLTAFALGVLALVAIASAAFVTIVMFPVDESQPVEESTEYTLTTEEQRVANRIADKIIEDYTEYIGDAEKIREVDRLLGILEMEYQCHSFLGDEGLKFEAQARHAYFVFVHAYVSEAEFDNSSSLTEDEELWESCAEDESCTERFTDFCDRLL